MTARPLAAALALVLVPRLAAAEPRKVLVLQSEGRACNVNCTGTAACVAKIDCGSACACDVNCRANAACSAVSCKPGCMSTTLPSPFCISTTNGCNSCP